LKCMVLDKFYPRNRVKAAHIWKHATHGLGLEEFGLEASDVDSPRNGLLLSEDLEKSFDNKDICFIYNPMNRQIVLFVLNPILKDAEKPTIVAPSNALTFLEVDGLPLLVKNPPFRRLLAFHAKCAIHDAYERGWISNIDKQSYQTLLDLSEDAHGFPDDDFEKAV